MVRGLGCLAGFGQIALSYGSICLLHKPHCQVVHEFVDIHMTLGFDVEECLVVAVIQHFVERLLWTFLNRSLQLVNLEVLE